MLYYYNQKVCAPSMVVSFSLKYNKIIIIININSNSTEQIWAKPV